MDEQIRDELIAFLPRLRRFTHALTGNQDDGDEILQAACERAIRHIDKWHPGTRLDSWIFKIARNLHLNMVRGRGLRGDHLVPVDAEQQIGDPVDSTRAMENRLTYEAVRRKVGLLPEEQRSVLLLICVEGLSYKEVAEVLEVPIGTVTSRLARARSALKGYLEEPVASGRAKQAGMGR